MAGLGLRLHFSAVVTSCFLASVRSQASVQNKSRNNVPEQRCDERACCALLHVRVSHSVVSDSLQPQGLRPTRLLCPRDSPGKNTGVGCRALLQGIFPTQGSNLSLLH